jgi:spermidine/putrescine-binding protein
MLEPKVAASLSNYTNYASPNQEARKHVNTELLHDKNLYPEDNILDRCEEIADVGKAVFVYDRLWTELKCV